ncbi:MAG: HAD-IIB family hydrolase [Gammaproteobacteria bacterium]|jgi:sucrose-6F-phosphate phosphohydrolase
MNAMQRLLLCTDLDRTLLPNGRQPESPGARERFQRLVARPEVKLAFVTGRHRALVQEAIDAYALPRPDFVIGDVGTTIYAAGQGDWQPRQDWQREIAADWAGYDHAGLAALFAAFDELEQQESTKQNDFKLSYYVAPDIDHQTLMEGMQALLQSKGIRASLVWSIDEQQDIGLLDVLPACATKLHAVDFLRRHLDYSLEETVFAGDSGNDLQVLASAVPAVLVANAAPDVRDAAVKAAAAGGYGDALYLARGGFLGMNGNYSAGIIEGVAHYRPELGAWLEGDKPHD